MTDHSVEFTVTVDDMYQLSGIAHRHSSFKGQSFSGDLMPADWEWEESDVVRCWFSFTDAEDARKFRILGKLSVGGRS
jgi:hypothetical protein